MKRKVVLLTTFVLVALLVAGGTMAWFTHEVTISNIFKAGKVKIKVIEDFDQEAANNVNPGQCIQKEVAFMNDGTKDIYVRAKIVPKWYDKAGNEVNVNAEYEVKEGKKGIKKLFISNISLPKDDENQPMFIGKIIRWFLKLMCPSKPPTQEDSKEWLTTGEDNYEEWVYYSHYLRPGEKTSNLIDKVCFDGETMSNDVQGFRFKLDIEAEAIQASHNAYKSEWGEDIELQVHP